MAIVDARRLDAGSVIRADVCIIGAGAAGLTIAREFAGTGLKAAVIESGDMTFRHATQFLNIGVNTGIPSFPTTHSRFRQFGGSITRWAGQCRPLDAIDFEAREEVPDSGWPFGLDCLIPYYRRAHEICDLGAYEYRPEAVAGVQSRMLPIESADLDTRMFRFSPPAWLVESSARCLAAGSDVCVYLNANVVRLEVQPDRGSIAGLAVSTLDGRRQSVVAGVYILACGGIENARLMLASNDVVENGVGNDHGLVGRYFMDHPYFLLGYFDPADAEYDRTPYVIEDYAEAGRAMRWHAAFGLAERVLRSEKLNNAALFLIRRPGYKTRPEYFSATGRSLQHLVEIVRHRTVPDRSTSQHLRRVARAPGEVVSLLRQQLGELIRPDPKLALRAVLEATPCRDSRVTLDTRRDRLGVPRVRVHWQMNPGDLRGLRRLLDVLREEFPRLGLGRLVDSQACDPAGWPASMTGGKHHMGTTRMNEDPASGVVDANCRVHGLSNLYVAGSSVFPTGGCANPTLTIVAMSLRLSDHLKQCL